MQRIVVLLLCLYMCGVMGVHVTRTTTTITSMTACPDLAPLRSPAVDSPKFDPSLLQGLWFESAYTDIAQVGASCQTLNGTYDATTGKLIMAFDVKYGPIPFNLPELYTPVNSSLPGIYSKNAQGMFSHVCVCVCVSVFVCLCLGTSFLGLALFWVIVLCVLISLPGRCRCMWCLLTILLLFFLSVPGGSLLTLPTVFVDVTMNAAGDAYDSVSIFSCLNLLGTNIIEMIFATRTPVTPAAQLAQMEQVATSLNVPYDPKALTLVNRTGC